MTKIKVFKSTRDDVEKLYGKPTNSEFRTSNGKSKPTYFRRYELSNFRVTVWYSRGDCKIENPVWNLPEWTVTEINYSPDEGLIKKSDLMSNKIKYMKSQEGDVVGHILYSNVDEGISFLYDRELKEVRHIKFFPSGNDRKSKDCNLRN